MHKKFLNFLQKLDIEPTLLEAVLNGYEAVFQESVNSWAVNYTPAVNPVGNPIGDRPMGDYKKIMKQEPSSVGAAGGAGDNTRGGNGEYKYEPGLRDCARNQGQETREQWEQLPKFYRNFANSGPNNPVKDLIKNAKEHIPQAGQYMNAQPAQYTNYDMSRYNVSASNPKHPPF